MSSVNEAIARSISHNEIVTIEGGADERALLAAQAENSVLVRHGKRIDFDRYADMVEYWGTEDGDEWRVHLVLTR